MIGRRCGFVQIDKNNRMATTKTNPYESPDNDELIANAYPFKYSYILLAVLVAVVVGFLNHAGVFGTFFDRLVFLLFGSFVMAWMCRGFEYTMAVVSTLMLESWYVYQMFASRVNAESEWQKFGLEGSPPTISLADVAFHLVLMSLLSMIVPLLVRKFREAKLYA